MAAYNEYDSTRPGKWTGSVLGGYDVSDYDAAGNLNPNAIKKPVEQMQTQSTTNPDSTVKLSNAAMSGAAAPTPQTTQQANTAVLNKAQQQVLNQQQAPSQLNQAYTQQSQNLVNNPFGDWNPQKIKQATMEKADTDWANQFEAQRRQYGNVSGSGLLQENMLQNALAHDIEQANLGATLDQQAYDQYLKGMTTAINQGKSVEESNQNIFSQGLANAATVRGMAEGEAGREATSQQQQAAIKADYDKMVASQDWQGAQAELDRQQQLAVQNNDYSKKSDLAKMQADLDMQKIIQEQGYEAAQKHIDDQLKIAMQNNDLNTQLDLQRLGAKYEMDKLLQQMGNEQTLAYIQRGTQLALQSNDEAQQEKMAALQYDYDMRTLDKTQNWQAQQNKIDNSLKELLAYRADQMTTMQMNQQMTIVKQQLELDKWKQENGQTFTADQNLLNRQLELSLKTQDIQGQQDLMNLKGKIDSGAQLTAQDFQTQQNALDRALDQAKTTQNLDTQKELAKLQIQADLTRLQKTQDFTATQQDIQNKFTAASQQNDINAQSSIIDRQLALDKWKQESGQKFTAEQNGLNRALELTKQTNDTEAQKMLMNLKGDIDKGMLASQQDFQAMQEKIQRDFESFTAQGDFSRAKEMETLKASIDAAAQANLQKWQTGERTATQAWQTGERISEQNFQTATQYIDQQNKVALQSNDIAAQKYLADQKNKLDLQMQTNDMDQQTKMAYIQDQLLTAQKNGDLAREKTLYEFQANQDINKIWASAGAEQSNMAFKELMDEALATQQYGYASALQKAQFAQQSNENNSERLLEEKKIALQKAGLNWDMMQAAIKVDPDSAAKIMNAALAESGISISGPDPLSAQKAIDQQYELMQYQFLKTHPEYANADDPSQMSDEGISAFNASINGTGGDLVDPISDAIANPSKYTGGNVSTSQNYSAFQKLISSATNFNTSDKYSDKITLPNRGGTWTYEFPAERPAYGTVYKDGDNYYIVTSEVGTMPTGGTNKATQYFSVLNPATGTSSIIKAQDYTTLE